MTEDQYKRAVAIYKRIYDLEAILLEIHDKSSHRLYYAYESSREYRLCPEWSMCPIGDILDRHDRAIRKEIQDEIDSLKKEIESL